MTDAHISAERLAHDRVVKAAKKDEREEIRRHIKYVMKPKAQTHLEGLTLRDVLDHLDEKDAAEEESEQ